MPSLEDIGEPTDREMETVETALEAIDASDRLGVVPFVDNDSDERVLFLVALRDDDDEEVQMHPIGPVYDFDEITDRFEMPDELEG